MGSIVINDISQLDLNVAAARKMNLFSVGSLFGNLLGDKSSIIAFKNHCLLKDDLVFGIWPHCNAVFEGQHRNRRVYVDH